MQGIGSLLYLFTDRDPRATGTGYTRAVVAWKGSNKLQSI